MKRRYVYLLLFGPSALLASAMGAVTVFGAAAGVAWLFLFGDDPWPATGETALVAIAIATFTALLLVLLRLAYVLGRKEEESARLNAGHVAISLGAALLLVGAGAYHQVRVGNLGVPHESIVCADFCRDAGFTGGSQMPPRNAGARVCICLDARGREAANVSIDEIRKHVP